MDKIKEIIEEIYSEVVQWRRDFHRYPELSCEEKRTSEKIVQILKNLQLEVHGNVGGYGVVGILRGTKPGKTIAIRADMDALPICEKNDNSYVSEYEGKMHACGHDGHMAILLGTATILSRLRDELEGTVKFIFQPAEEKAPIGGAKAMIESGVLENDKVNAILGLHIWPNLPKGQIGVKEGPLMSSSDPFKVEIYGKGGHASAPHDSVDALVTACQVVNLLQLIVSREIDPSESTVVTVGKLQSGVRYNVIADLAVLEGTVRTTSPLIAKSMKERIEKVVNGVCMATGANSKVFYEHGYPALINDKAITSLVRLVASEILTKENVINIHKPDLGGEDFAYYLQKIPGTFFWLGAQENNDYPLHNPMFDFDESIMKIGIEIFIKSVFKFLNTKEFN